MEQVPAHVVSSHLLTFMSLPQYNNIYCHYFVNAVFVNTVKHIRMGLHSIASERKCSDVPVAAAFGFQNTVCLPVQKRQ